MHVRPIKETGREAQRLGSVAAEHLLTRDAAGRIGSHAELSRFRPRSSQSRCDRATRAAVSRCRHTGSSSDCLVSHRYSKRKWPQAICARCVASGAARSKGSRSRCWRSRCSPSPCSPGKARSARRHRPSYLRYYRRHAAAPARGARPPRHRRAVRLADLNRRRRWPNAC